MHPENFIFIVNIISDKAKYYQIYFTDPDTGRKSEIIHFLQIGPALVDTRIHKKIALRREVLIEQFEYLALNKEQGLLDKGEENIEDEA